MRTPLIVLVCLSLCVVTACGGSSAPLVSGGPSGSTVNFRLGDEKVVLDDVELLFGPAGAPQDGVLGMFSRAEAEREAQDAQLGFLVFALLYYVAPQMFLPDAVALLDLAGFLTVPAPDRLTFDLGAVVADDDQGSIVPQAGVTVRVDAVTGQATATLPRTESGRLGMIALGILLDIQRTLRGDGTADLDMALSTTADSPLDADEVLILIGGNIIEDLGPLQANTATTRSTQVNVDELDVGVEVRFIAADDSWFEDIGVDFSFSLPPLTPRLASVGMSNEGVTSVGEGMWNQIHPGTPLAPGEFGVSLAGQHHLDLGKLGVDLFDSVDARPQPGSPAQTTYRSLTIGVVPGSPGYPLVGPHARQAQMAPVMAALVAVGSWGISIANFDNGLGAFAPDSVVEAGNMTDLSAAGGDPQSGAAVYVDHSADAIKFIMRDGMGQYVLDPAATRTNASWPGASGAVVSAFLHGSGDLLFVTDGEPGEFWVLASGATTATRIGTVGDAPRNVRAAGNVAAVGSYGTGLGFGGVTLFVRSAGGTWGYAPFSRTGPRAVGIDAKQLPDGRVAVVAPSFTNNEIVLMVLDNTTGEIRKDEVIALPAGASGPGHCAFLRAAADAVLVSCNTSNHLALIPVSYDEAP